MKINVFANLALALSLGCSTASVRIIPGQDGLNKAVVRDIERNKSEEAIEAATEYCEQRNQSVEFLEGAAEHSGDFRKASQSAFILGRQGSVLGSASTAGYSKTFRCQ